MRKHNKCLGKAVDKVIKQKKVNCILNNSQKGDFLPQSQKAQ